MQNQLAVAVFLLCRSKTCSLSSCQQPCLFFDTLSLCVYFDSRTICLSFIPLCLLLSASSTALPPAPPFSFLILFSSCWLINALSSYLSASPLSPLLLSSVPLLFFRRAFPLVLIHQAVCVTRLPPSLLSSCLSLSPSSPFAYLCVHFAFRSGMAYLDHPAAKRHWHRAAERSRLAGTDGSVFLVIQSTTTMASAATALSSSTGKIMPPTTFPTWLRTTLWISSTTLRRTIPISPFWPSTPGRHPMALTHRTHRKENSKQRKLFTMRRQTQSQQCSRDLLLLLPDATVYNLLP